MHLNIYNLRDHVDFILTTTNFLNTNINYMVFNKDEFNYISRYILFSELPKTITTEKTDLPFYIDVLESTKIKLEKMQSFDFKKYKRKGTSKIDKLQISQVEKDKLTKLMAELVDSKNFFLLLDANQEFKILVSKLVSFNEFYLNRASEITCNFNNSKIQFVLGTEILFELSDTTYYNKITQIHKEIVKNKSQILAFIHITSIENKINVLKERLFCYVGMSLIKYL